MCVYETQKKRSSGNGNGELGGFRQVLMESYTFLKKLTTIGVNPPVSYEFLNYYLASVARRDSRRDSAARKILRSA